MHHLTCFRKVKCVVLSVLILAIIVVCDVYCKSDRFEKEQESVQAMIELPVAELNIPVKEMDKSIADERKKIYYDIPLKNQYQDYVIKLSEKYNVPPKIIFAIMWQESKFDFMAVSHNRQCVGIMQVNRINYDELHNKLGVTDLTKPKQNIESGIYLYSKLLHKYNDVHKALVCYNCGEIGGKDILKNSYSNSVINYEKNIKEE